MRSRKIETQLEMLDALRAAELTDEAAGALRKALKDRVNLVVAKAASTAAHLRARVLIPDLLTAFDRLFEKGSETDAQCWGKNALGKALKDLGQDESAPFIRGMQYVQMEPVWGSRVDTAGTLRGVCVLALLQCTDLTRDDKLWHFIRALTDTEATVRIEAARALEEMAGREAALLLRLKGRMGDKEASVTGQVLASLLQIEREHAVPFVSEFLENGERQLQQDLRHEAAVALGASRQPAAIDALIEHWRRSKGIQGEGILRGISVSRLDVAFDFLLKLVAEGNEAEAIAALDALTLHRDSFEIRARVTEAIGGRRERSLIEQFRRQFPAP